MPTFQRIQRVGPRGPGGLRRTDSQPSSGTGPAFNFVSRPGAFGSKHIRGVTRDSGGAALASCTVKLFRTSDDFLIATTTSDGSGNYDFPVQNDNATYYVVAYKSGAPDVSGTTTNSLAGA